MTRFLLAALLLLPLPARAQLVPPGEVVRIGVPVTVAVEGADTLYVVYRPNAAVSQRDVVLTGGAARVAWTPERAGVVQLVAGASKQNVSVRYVTPPAGGIFVLLVAGFILFGGAAYALKKLFED